MATKVFCSNCGKQLVGSDNFCSSCGSKGYATLANDSAGAKASTAQAASPRPAHKRWGFWLVLFIIVVLIVNANRGGNNGGGSQSPAVTSQSSGAALTAFFKQSNNQLNLCVVGIGVTQIELGQVLKAGANATQTDMLNLYQAAKQAEGPCDPAQNNDLNNLTLASSPSGYATLANFGVNLASWADSDCVAVLKDVEAVANNPSSTADIANLITDAGTADADAHSLQADATRAAQQGHVKNIGGNDLLYWGLQTG